MSYETVGRQMEILLVEDSLTDAALTIGALKQGKIKHRLTLVRDGEEALEFLRQEGRFGQAPRPDLILLDLLLPKLNGVDVLAQVREDYDIASIPVVILTSSDDYDDRERCEALSVESYITKPVNLDKFISVVRELKDHWHADLILPLLD
jgi:chemotaxis family two-component system response regulator Rcp1